MADIPKLYRVILQVSDLDKGADFYSRLLGTEGRRIYGGFRHYFDCGEVILALVDPSADEEKARPNPDNIYFSVQDLEAVHARAKELGCLSTGDVHGETPLGRKIVLRIRSIRKSDLFCRGVDRLYGKLKHHTRCYVSNLLHHGGPPSRSSYFDAVADKR